MENDESEPGTRWPVLSLLMTPLKRRGLAPTAFSVRLTAGLPLEPSLSAVTGNGSGVGDLTKLPV